MENKIPRLDPAALGTVDPKDHVRQRGFGALGHAQVIGAAICAAARSAHADMSMDLPSRHRRAAELAAKAILPFIDTLSKTQAIYAKDIGKIHETLDGPVGDFNELQLTEIRSRLGGLKPTERYAAVIRAIEKGNDAVLAAVLKANDFLVEFLSDAERAEILKKWRAARFPEQYARLVQLESDSAKIEGAGKILQSYALQCANQSIVADGVPPAANPRGAPGPAPVNRANSMSLEQRAAHMTQVIAAAGR